jgi:hypothetical protein
MTQQPRFTVSVKPTNFSKLFQLQVDDTSDPTTSYVGFINCNELQEVRAADATPTDVPMNVVHPNKNGDGTARRVVVCPPSQCRTSSVVVADAVLPNVPVPAEPNLSGPAVHQAPFHAKVVAALTELNAKHPFGTTQRSALHCKAEKILTQMLKTPVGIALAKRDGWVGFQDTKNKSKVNMELLKESRDVSEKIYKFHMHLMNDVVGLNVPEVIGTDFYPRHMCVGFVFVPITECGKYDTGLPAQLVSTTSEESVLFGEPVSKTGGGFHNNLSKFRLPVLDEIVAMLAKRPIPIDASLF